MMRPHRIPGAVSVAVLAWVVSSAGVDLTLFNTEALLDSDQVTPLEGVAAGGDLVQLIVAGDDGLIDPPNGDGSPGGDDYLLPDDDNPTHVGAGVTATNNGLFVQSGIVYGNEYIGTNVYVRFWNGDSLAAATHFGETAVTNLPPGDGFGLAQLDVVPTTSYARTVDTTVASIPSLPVWGLPLLTVILLWLGFRRHRSAATTT